MARLQSVEVQLRGRLYSANPQRHLRPYQILISTRQLSLLAQLQRFPFVENHIAGLCFQPWIHNCTVTVKEGRHMYRFMVFFKCHKTFGPNRCLQALLQGQPSLICSDVVVMQIGDRSSYVNMRGGRDTILADWMMKR